MKERKYRLQKNKADKRKRKQYKKEKKITSEILDENIVKKSEVIERERKNKTRNKNMVFERWCTN